MTDTPTSTEPDTLDPDTVVKGGTHVHVTHPDAGEWDCPIDYLPTARLRGWTPTVPAAATFEELFDPGTGPSAGEAGGVPEETGYNPDDHTVDEVNTYLDGLLGESPGEVARVLEAETAGQARKTILHGRHGVPEDPDAASNS